MHVVKQVEEMCLPWLEHMSSMNNVKSFVAKNNRAFVVAGMALFQSNREEASICLEQALKQQPLAKAGIIAWGKKHGLVQA